MIHKYSVEAPSTPGARPVVISMSKEDWVEMGAKGLAVPQDGMRPATFKFLAEGGQPSKALPVTIVVYPEGRRAIVDGRHRITMARMNHQQSVPGVMWAMGPRGGRLWSYTGKIMV